MECTLNALLPFNAVFLPNAVSGTSQLALGVAWSIMAVLRDFDEVKCLLGKRGSFIY